MSGIVIFLLLAAAFILVMALLASITAGIYNMLPGRLKKITDLFFELNDNEGALLMDQVEVKKQYGPENKKPQLTQLYQDLSMLLGERSALQSALTEIQEIAANSNLDFKAKQKIDNVVSAALGYDGQGGRQAVNN